MPLSSFSCFFLALSSLHGFVASEFCISKVPRHGAPNPCNFFHFLAPTSPPPGWVALPSGWLSPNTCVSKGPSRPPGEAWLARVAQSCINHRGNRSITLFRSPAKRRGATRGLPGRSPILVPPSDSIRLPESVHLSFCPSTVSKPPDNVVRSFHSRPRNPCHFFHFLAPTSPPPDCEALPSGWLSPNM